MTSETIVESPSESTITDALDQQFSATPKPVEKTAPEAVETESAAQANPEDEASPDDLREVEGEEPVETDAQAPEDFALDVVVNGTQHKLNRDDTVKYAQIGMHADQQLRVAGETRRAFEAGLQRIAQIEQIQPQVAQIQGHAAALAMQLQSEKYSDQKLYQLATEDPFEAQKLSMERDILRNQFTQAHSKYEQAKQYIDQQKQEMQEQLLQQEHARLPEVIPAWRDETKMQQDKVEIAKYLHALGVDMTQVGRYLDNAIAMKVARDAMNYQRLSKLKTDKSKQLRTAPPVVKPGTALQDKGRADREALSVIRKAGKSGNQRAQEDALLGLLNKTFK